MPRSRLLPALALLVLAPAVAQAQGAPPLRDPTLPYESWGAAARETAGAIAGSTLSRPADGRYRVGDAVIVDDDGKRYRAHVIEAQATRVRVRYDGFGPNDVRFHDLPRVLGYQPGFAPVPAPATAGAPAVAATAIGPGKWGCTESYWRVTKGTYDFEMRGSFTLHPNGTYEYTGMSSRGRWRWDAAQSAVVFTGGFLDRARAVRLEDGPRIRLELPTNDPERPRKWACGRADTP